MRKNLSTITYTIAIVMMAYNLAFTLIRKNQSNTIRELYNLKSNIGNWTSDEEIPKELSAIRNTINSIERTKDNYDLLFYISLIGAPLVLMLSLLIREQAKNERKRLEFESSQKSIETNKRLIQIKPNKNA